MSTLSSLPSATMSTKPVVTKMNGTVEPVDFSLIQNKLRRLCELESQLLKHVNYTDIARLTICRMGNVVISTTELDEIAAEVAADMVLQHYEYSQLAARIWMSRLHKIIPQTFSQATTRMFVQGVKLHRGYVNFVSDHAAFLDSLIQHDRDLTSYDYFGVRTLAKSYLLRYPLRDDVQQSLSSFDGLAETPQYMLMRIAVAINLPAGEDVSSSVFSEIAETYEQLSTKRYTHATPTMFNAGLEVSTLASCYLLTISRDSIEGVFETLTRSALVSKASGGVGINISNVRATGTPIRQTNGRSGGIVPMLRVFNDVARYVDQGGGKRPGAYTIYLEPWHADFEDFVRLSRKTGVEEKLTRDLFTAVWCCDLFMQRVERDELWSLMCPKLSPGLTDVWGAHFEDLYTRYEHEKRYVRQVPAKQLWLLLVRTQLESGMPFFMHKDHVNARNNQMNCGTIRGSNLCTEITLYTSHDEVAVCNLASVSLPAFIRADATDWSCPNCLLPPEVISPSFTVNRYDLDCEMCTGGFDFEALYNTVLLVTRNLDRTIDRMHYPIDEARLSNTRHRPIGIGVSGLADVFARLRIDWSSPIASRLNRRIFETLYRASLHQSCLLSRDSIPYLSYDGSPVDVDGLFQHNLYDIWADRFDSSSTGSNRDSSLANHRYHERDSTGDWLVKLVPGSISWSDFRQLVAKFGLRHSQRLAPMPTATTAQILGNCESIEPRTSNLFYRRVQAGEFIVLNRQLVDDMLRLGVWDETRIRKLVENRGSVQSFAELPAILRSVYRTVWELPQRLLVDLTADRQPFIDQSQSFNLYFVEPDFKRLTNAHFYAWRHGLKTGMYYLRTKSAVEPIQFSVGEKLRSYRPTASAHTTPPTSDTCSIDDPTCVSCVL